MSDNAGVWSKGEQRLQGKGEHSGEAVSRPDTYERFQQTKGFLDSPWEMVIVLSTGAMTRMKATWLILPVVICLSQRLSHACLSINCYTVKLRMAH